jgi:hypothetical protein
LVVVTESSATVAVNSHEVGVTEIACSRRAIDVTPGPEIAAGKATEHGSAASVTSLTLQSVENLFYCIGHDQAALCRDARFICLTRYRETCLISDATF